MEVRRTGHLVCPTCWDAPNYSVRSKSLPPDPVPILNPRTESDGPAGVTVDPDFVPPKIP